MIVHSVEVVLFNVQVIMRPSLEHNSRLSLPKCAKTRHVVIDTRKTLRLDATENRLKGS